MKTYHLLRFASWLSKFVPARMAYWLCSIIGGVLFYLKPSIRNAVMDNMRHVLPDSSRHQRRTIARKVIRNTVKNYYDLVRLPHMTQDDLKRTIKLYGTENLEEARAGGKGAILVGGHIGNFSIVAQMAAILGYNPAIVAEDIEPETLYNYINHLRGGFGVKMLKTGSSQVRTLFKLIKSNGMVMLAADRDVTNTGVPVPFFGGLADLPPGPVVLALRLNTPLIPVHTVRLRDNSSIANIYPPMQLDRTGDIDRDTKTNMRKLTQILEEMISKAPDQWVVLQRVWEQEPTKQQAVESQPDNRPALEEPSLDGHSHEPEPVAAGQTTTPTEERSPSSVTT
jgi:KDO2-lipid IV(A) lauroyltransferase